MLLERRSYAVSKTRAIDGESEPLAAVPRGSLPRRCELSPVRPRVSDVTYCKNNPVILFSKFFLRGGTVGWL